MPSTESELKRALGAFKKRLKAIRLDDDSRLGHGPLSGSRREKVVSIQPPTGFGRAVWEELADLGYLKRDTVGFYELTDKQWQSISPGAPPSANP
jgi:hypothetical protein